MEIFKFILTTYGPTVAAVIIMIYLCFFTKKEMNGNEKQLKDQLSSVLRENAELKVQVNKAMAELNKKVDDLNVEVGQLMEEADNNESNNDRT